jgi:hypothetical protein
LALGSSYGMWWFEERYVALSECSNLLMTIFK